MCQLLEVTISDYSTLQCPRLESGSGAGARGAVRILPEQNRQKQNAVMGVEKMEMEDTDSTLMEKGAKPPAPRPPNKYETLFQPCLAEIVGTMFFVFVGCVSVIENVPAAGRLQPALVHGLAVAVMVAVMDNIR